MHSKNSSGASQPATDNFVFRVPAWVRRATDRNGQILGAPARLLLIELWSHGTPNLGHHTFVHGPNLSLEALADVLGWSSRNAQRLLTILRHEGLAARGENNGSQGIWLADVQGIGRFSPNEIPRSVGHVYAVEFSNGTVKVGRAVSPEKRILNHQTTAAAFGVSIVRKWISESCDAQGVEERLIASLTERGATVSGREWFTGVPFDEIVDLVLSLVGEE